MSLRCKKNCSRIEYSREVKGYTSLFDGLPFYIAHFIGKVESWAGDGDNCCKKRKRKERKKKAKRVFMENGKGSGGAEETESQSSMGMGMGNMGILP